MYQTITQSDFHDAFHRMDRGNQFSWEGREKLFDYITEVEESDGQEIELDVIAICCDCTEYESLEEFREECANPENYPDLDALREDTLVLELSNGGFIIQNF